MHGTPDRVLCGMFRLGMLPLGMCILGPLLLGRKVLLRLLGLVLILLGLLLLGRKVTSQQHLGQGGFSCSCRKVLLRLRGLVLAVEEDHLRGNGVLRSHAHANGMHTGQPRVDLIRNVLGLLDLVILLLGMIILGRNVNGSPRTSCNCTPCASPALSSCEALLYKACNT